LGEIKTNKKTKMKKIQLKEKQHK